MNTIRRLSGSNPNTPERVIPNNNRSSPILMVDGDVSLSPLANTHNKSYKSNNDDIVWCFPAIFLVFFVLGLVVFFEYGLESHSLALVLHSDVIKSNSYLNSIIMKMKFKLVEIISISKIIFGESGVIVSHMKAITSPLTQSESIKSIVDTTMALVVTTPTTPVDKGHLFFDFISDADMATPMLIGVLVVISLAVIAAIVIFGSNSSSSDSGGSSSNSSSSSSSNNNNNNNDNNSSNSSKTIGKRTKRTATKHSM